MGITIRQALALPELAEVQVAAGAGGLDRVIQTVSVMEVPDISAFVEAGELLLTTTYPICNNTNVLDQLVPMLAARGLVGLAIKPERYIDSIPSRMIEQANALDFPLLQLPKEPSFTKILNTILSEILHQQANLLRYSESIHRSLTDLVLRGAGSDLLVRTLSDLIKLPVVFTNPNMEVLVTSVKGESMDKLFRELLPAFKEKRGFTSVDEPVRYTVKDSDAVSSVFVHPVKAGKEIFGYICVGEKDDQLLSIGAIAVEQAAVALALDVQKKRAVEEMERRFLNDFVRDLLDGRISSSTEMKVRGRVYGWDAELPLVLLAIEIVADQASSTSVPVSIDHKMQQQQQIERAILREPSITPANTLVAHLGDITAVFLKPATHHEETTKREARQLAERILNKLSTYAHKEGYRISIGISRVCTEVKDFGRSFREACEAVQIHEQSELSQTVVHYDDLGVYRLLARIDDREELERFCRERLNKLLDYDAKSGAALIETLGAIIKANGNLQRASELLFIHYNTLRYRVKKIETLAGIKLDSWQAMMEVSLALKAYHILQVHKKEL